MSPPVTLRASRSLPRPLSYSLAWLNHRLKKFSDLLLILPPHKVEKLLAKRASQPQDKDDHNQDRAVNDIKVEDGRLYYDKKWYGRYQNVFVECRDFGKVPAVIQNICPADVILKKVTDGSKLKITIPSLQKGKYSLKRRCWENDNSCMKMIHYLVIKWTESRSSSIDVKDSEQATRTTLSR